MSEHEEIKWVEEVLNGNNNSFHPIYHKWYNWVRCIVYNHVPSGAVEETVQEAFINIYQNLHNWKKTALFKSWIRTIVIRSAWQYWRKNGKKNEIQRTNLNEAQKNALQKVLDDEAMEKELLNNEKKAIRESLDWALSRLKPADSMIIKLVHLEGFTATEAAEMLGWSRINVLVKAHRVRGKLKKILQKEVYNA